MSINLVALTGAALVNGLNPCGIGMMITFLGYLLVFGNSKNSKTQKIKNSKYGISLDSGILKDGLIYLASVFVTYLFLGLFFYGLAFYLQRLWLASVFKYVMAGILTIAGLIQFKDVFWENFPIHLRMSSKGYEKINLVLMKAGSGMGVVVGVLTTAFSTPCMLPVYIGTTSYLAKSGLPMWQVLIYFLYYNFVFILPILVILLVMAGGKKVVEMKEWEHKYSKQLRLLMAIFLFGIAYFLIK
jgi:cytochrome c biogenesis protein CcdA